MYELIQVGENTFYMDCPVKVGFYRISDDEVVLIDSGSDKDAAKKVKRILDENHWKVKAIFNTHSHADHIGGNQYLQNQTGCKIYAKGLERAFAEKTILEPTALYGGKAMKELHNKFLMAKESMVEELTGDILPKGLEIIDLPGHSYEMVGFRTSDDVVFLADCLSSIETLEKYQVGYIYDVGSYIDTLEKVKELKARVFVPSHAETTDEITEIVQYNIDKTKEIADAIAELLSQPKAFEELVTGVFNNYSLTMTLQQNVLIGSAIKSYLTYLMEQEQITYYFENNRMLWQVVKND